MLHVKCKAVEKKPSMDSQGRLPEATAPIQNIVLVATTNHIATLHRIISLSNTAAEHHKRKAPDTNLNRKRRKAHLSAKVGVECSRSNDTCEYTFTGKPWPRPGARDPPVRGGTQVPETDPATVVCRLGPEPHGPRHVRGFAGLETQVPER